MSTAERVNHQEISDNYVLQRSIAAYVQAAQLVQGNVLEIGTGSGYGIDYIAPHCEKFVTIDKFKSTIDFSQYKNVEFIQQKVPPLPFKDNTFDFVVSFQVIEHIKDDHQFVREIHRVLKSKGKCIITTPNILTTLTRNPWHVREYTKEQLHQLFNQYFSNVQMLGVFGNDKVMKYYEHNKQSVQKLLKWDILDLQHRLPRWALQIPYDILNRWNRKKLLRENPLTKDITVNDFFIKSVDDSALDLFCIAEK